MRLNPQQVFSEYTEARDFKTALGNRGLYEQNRINERFYIGDQWHGAKCGNERPLVRHNIIKRIGDYKMSQVMGNPLTVSFSADGVPNIIGCKQSLKLKKSDISKDAGFSFSGSIDNQEVNLVMSALSDYRNVTAERVGFDALSEKALRNAYITGSAVFYTYWDPDISTGLYADDSRNIAIKGDINCEVLDIENVYFGDPYNDDVQTQPYIIIASHRSSEEVKREALRFGSGRETVGIIDENSEDGKILVLTRLYKEYNSDGNYTIKCVKAIRGAFIRREFDTGLRLYPIAIFNWERRNNLVYGESEITYLIPNQIAINRMITANVWSAMAMGMPMMIVNGDTVTDGITNDPGQIIKVFGSNEDVSGAVKYVTPPPFGENFNTSINSLIENTLTQSGANEVALGDSRADNATALMTMRDAAVMPLQLIKTRYYAFVENISRIWADFWITHYGNRRIKVVDENGIWYMPFDSDRYRELMIKAKVNVGAGTVYSEAESVNVLTTLFEKGIISKRQFIKRLPDGIIPDSEGLLEAADETEDSNDDRL